MKATTQDALSSCSTSPSLEELAGVLSQKDMMGSAAGAGAGAAGRILAEGADVVLLSEFISGVNLELGEVVFMQVQQVTLSAGGGSVWYGKLWSALPFAVIWAGVQRYSGASRCSLNMQLGDRRVEVSGSTAEEVERLYKLAAADLIVSRLPDSPPQD